MGSSSRDETGPRLSYEVGLNSLDATLDVIASSGRVSSLSQGLFRHLRSAIRANTGAKAGRYYFEVQVLERIPEAPALLLAGFSTDRSSLFLGSQLTSVGFDSKGSSCSTMRPAGELGEAKRVGLLLDQEVKDGSVSVFLDGEQVGSTAIPHLCGKALFPTVTFQNVTLAVDFHTPGPERCRAFGSILEEHHARSSVQAAPKEVIIPVALPHSGLYDWSLRWREVQRPDFVEIGDDMMADWSALSCLSSRPDPSRAAGSRDDPHMACLGIEQLRSREVWRGALMDLAKNSRQSLIHSSVRRNLVEAERRSLLKNFPTAKKIAVVLFGKPDEDFRDWVKQRTRSDYEAAKEQLERRRSSAEAAGEEPPVDDLKEPPEADFPSKMEVSDKVLAHELKNFSLPDKAEGFDEIRYEWADEAGAKAGLLQWLREQKARRIVEGLAPGEWFDKKYKDWKDARRVFQNGQRDFSTRSQGDDSLADKVSAIDLSEVKDPHNADGEGTPIYSNFKYEDWVVLSWRYELHLLSHAFPIDAADSDRLGVPEEHMEHYWRIYYHHHFEPRKLGAANLRDALKVLKEPIQLKETSSGSRILVSTCDRESSIDAFVVSVEAYRRDRCRRIEAGDESAALNIPRQSKAPVPEGKATGKGVMKSAPKTTPKAKPPQPSSSPGPTGGKAPPKAPVAKMPAPQNSGGEAKRPHPPNAPPTKRTPEGHLAGRSGADQVKKAPPPKGSVGKLVAKPPQPSSSPGPTGGKAPPKAPVSKTPAKPQNSGGEGKAKVALAKMPAKRPHPPSNGPPTKRSRSEERG